MNTRVDFHIFFRRTTKKNHRSFYWTGVKFSHGTFKCVDFTVIAIFLTRVHIYMQAIVGVVMVLSLVVLLLSLRETTRTIDEASVETMGLALRHVAGNMQPLMEANRSAVAIADAAREPATNDEPSPASISQVLASFIFLFPFPLSPLLHSIYL